MSTTRDWWDSAHREPGNFFISDYGGKSLWKSLHIARMIKPGRYVLEIGVGGGSDIARLHERGVNVDVVDIVPISFEKIKNVSRRQWLESEMENLPPDFYDLAISHLVTQHISNEALSRQIQCVLRSLKPKGIFAMQFADLIAGISEGQYSQTLELQQTGGVCRSLDMMNAIVTSSGGRISWSRVTQKFPEHKSRWLSIHIVRDATPRP